MNRIWPFLLLFFALSHQAQAVHWRLKIDYDLKCQDMLATMAQGEIELLNAPHSLKRLFIQLFKHQHQADVFLGDFGIEIPKFKTTFRKISTLCEPEQIKTLLLPIIPLSQKFKKVLEHAPYLAPRKATYNRSSDALMKLAYQWEDAQTLTYTAYFTDEDSQLGAVGTEMQMGTYGRRTDTEWVYRVKFDAQDNVVRREYQGGILSNTIGHKTREFKGHLVDNRPVLYISSANNIFSDRPHLLAKQDLFLAELPLKELKMAHRDQVVFENPWMLQVSDMELFREVRATHRSSEYLFAEFKGQLTGSFLMRLEGPFALSGMGVAPVREMGFAAIRHTSQGQFSLVPSLLTKKISLKIQGLRFFKIRRENSQYKVVLKQSQCQNNGMNLMCTLGDSL